MSFADDLQNISPEAMNRRKQECLRELEENPDRLSALFTSKVEGTIKAGAECAARQGKTTLSGYLTASNDDYLSSGPDFHLGKYSIRDIDVQKVLGDLAPVSYFVLIDRIYINPYNEAFSVIWESRGGLLTSTWNLNKDIDMLSQKTVDTICASISEKLKELGFKHYSVVQKKQQFYGEKNEKGLFGKTRTVVYPYDIATLLWIEVSW